MYFKAYVCAKMVKIGINHCSEKYETPIVLAIALDGMIFCMSFYAKIDLRITVFFIPGRNHQRKVFSCEADLQHTS